MNLNINSEMVPLKALFNLNSSSIDKIREQFQVPSGEDLVIEEGGEYYIDIHEYFESIQFHLAHLKEEALDAPCMCKPQEYLDAAFEATMDLSLHFSLIASLPHMQGIAFDRKADRELLEATEQTFRQVFDHFINATGLLFAQRGINDQAKAGHKGGADSTESLK